MFMEIMMIMKLTREDVELFLKNQELKLKPRQSKLSLPILQRIYMKMKGGVPFKDIQVYEGLIVNGHHRYICAKMAGTELAEQPWHRPGNGPAWSWEQVMIDTVDYDTKEEVQKHNEREAFLLGLDLKAFNIQFNSELH
jgi:hypothetical protein